MGIDSVNLSRVDLNLLVHLDALLRSGVSPVLLPASAWDSRR